MIWFGRDGIIKVGCAHCPKVTNSWDEPDEELLKRLVKSSQEGHKRSCGQRVK